MEIKLKLAPRANYSPEALNHLSPCQRVTYELWANGLLYRQIATKIGRPIGTVRSRVNRAREKLESLTA
jgi:DNA-directed RNA polymerase specialized sigma24 family protein